MQGGGIPLRLGREITETRNARIGRSARELIGVDVSPVSEGRTTSPRYPRPGLPVADERRTPHPRLTRNRAKQYRTQTARNTSLVRSRLGSGDLEKLNRIAVRVRAAQEQAIRGLREVFFQRVVLLHNTTVHRA